MKLIPTIVIAAFAILAPAPAFADPPNPPDPFDHKQIVTNTGLCISGSPGEAHGFLTPHAHTGVAPGVVILDPQSGEVIKGVGPLFNDHGNEPFTSSAGCSRGVGQPYPTPRA